MAHVGAGPAYAAPTAADDDAADAGDDEACSINFIARIQDCARARANGRVS